MNTYDAEGESGGKAAGFVIIAVAFLVMIMLHHHPQSATHEAGKLIAEIADLALADRVVHGTLIALMAALVFGYLEFCARLGFVRPAVRAGAVAYAMGVFAVVVAATIDGFVISALAEHYANAQPAELEAARHLLNLCAVCVRVFTSLGVVAMSAAIAAWSFALLRGPRQVLWLGAVGLIASLAPAIAILSGMVSINLPSLLIVMWCQTGWNLAAGFALVRGKV
jgi:hypothetical protein